MNKIPLLTAASKDLHFARPTMIGRPFRSRDRHSLTFDIHQRKADNSHLNWRSSSTFWQPTYHLGPTMRLLQLGVNDRLTVTKDLLVPQYEYAILSHTWGPDEEEMTFKGISEGTGLDKNEYQKILFCG